jgi:hypothetical protein
MKKWNIGTAPPTVALKGALDAAPRTLPAGVIAASRQQE